MPASLFFYDLETSGISPSKDRIMQFAGQRTDLNLRPLGEPINYLIRLNKDILPDPGAILIHGITPQQSLSDGISEAEFLAAFYDEVVKADTTFVGFNNIRFDDEFIRFLNYRNLYDPYAWAYEDNISRWDVLDVARLTRALRPKGINWPIDSKGANVNRLELLAKANKLKHINAHDALSDVIATIDLARLIKAKQPKLYSYAFKLRLKPNAAKLVNSGSAFVYTSSHYPSRQLHTTVVVKVADHPSKNCVLVYDLRFDPTPWLGKSAEALADAWRFTLPRNEIDNPPLPVKTIRLNRCPAIAPMNVIQEDKPTQTRLELDLKQVAANLKAIKGNETDFAGNLINAVKILNAEQDTRQNLKPSPLDARLYDSFYSDQDRKLLKSLHKGETPDKVRDLRQSLSDSRLKQLCSLYLARNYPSSLSDTERKGWEAYVSRQLFDGGSNSCLASYFRQLEQLSAIHPDKRSQLLLEDLKLYGESLVPSDLMN